MTSLRVLATITYSNVASITNTSLWETSNDSGIAFEVTSEWIVLPFLYIPVMVIGTAGNVLVSMAFLLYPHVRTISNAFVVALALADTSVILHVGITTVSEVVRRLLGLGDGLSDEALCVVSSNLTSMSIVASFTNLMVISVHRYARVISSNEHYMCVFGQKWKVGLWCALPWLLALPVSLHLRAHFLVPCFDCHPDLPRQVPIFVLYACVDSVILATYSTTIRRLHGFEKKAHIFSSEVKKQELLMRSKTLKARLIFSCINIHLYIPYLLQQAGVQFWPPDRVLSLAVMLAVSKWVLIIGTSSSSIAYGALNPAFRKALRSVLFCDSEVKQELGLKPKFFMPSNSLMSVMLSPAAANLRKRFSRKSSVLNTQCLPSLSNDTFKSSILLSSREATPRSLSTVPSISFDSLVDKGVPGETMIYFDQDDQLVQTSGQPDELPEFMDSLHDSVSNVFQFDSEYFDSSSSFLRLSDQPLLHVDSRTSILNRNTVDAFELFSSNPSGPASALGTPNTEGRQGKVSVLQCPWNAQPGNSDSKHFLADTCDIKPLQDEVVSGLTDMVQDVMMPDRSVTFIDLDLDSSGSEQVTSHEPILHDAQQFLNIRASPTCRQESPVAGLGENVLDLGSPEATPRVPQLLKDKRASSPCSSQPSVGGLGGELLALDSVPPIGSKLLLNDRHSSCLETSIASLGGEVLASSKHSLGEILSRKQGSESCLETSIEPLFTPLPLRRELDHHEPDEDHVNVARSGARLLAPPAPTREQAEDTNSCVTSSVAGQSEELLSKPLSEKSAPDQTASPSQASPKISVFRKALLTNKFVKKLKKPVLQPKRKT